LILNEILRAAGLLAGPVERGLAAAARVLAAGSIA